MKINESIGNGIDINPNLGGGKRVTLLHHPPPPPPPKAGFPLITQNGKRCNPSILQRSVTFY